MLLTVLDDGTIDVAVFAKSHPKNCERLFGKAILPSRQRKEIIMIKEVEICPSCGSKCVYFSKMKQKWCCENEECKAEFDKPAAVDRKINKFTIDTRRITGFLASSTKLKVERDMISSVAAESNGADHRTYVELDRCDDYNTIQLESSQQDLYNSWIRNSDVFVLLVSENGIGEYTENEIALAANTKREKGIKLLALVQNGAETGDSPENERWRGARSQYGDIFDDITPYDDLADLYVKVRELIDKLRGEEIGTVIKGCVRTGYDIVITGISERSKEYVYSFANEVNKVNNDNFREEEKNSLIFNLQIRLDELPDSRLNVNDYYFIFAGRSEEAIKYIGERYQSKNPYMFLDINVEERQDYDYMKFVNDISKAINNNYLYTFPSRDALIGKGSIRLRLEMIKKAYGDFQRGLCYFEDGNYFYAEKLFLEAKGFGFIAADFYLGYIYSEEAHLEYKDLDKAKEHYRLMAEKGHVNSQYNLGNLLAKAGNSSEAQKYYRMAAEQGDVEAQTYLGNLLKETGNLAEAEKFIRMAVKQEYAEAQLSLGIILEEAGKLPEAEKYYRMAAEQGYAAAQCNLGNLLYKAEKHSEAMKYWRLAMKQGHALAQHNIGSFFEKEEKPSEAKKYYRMAAEQGLAAAQYNLGGLLEDEGNRSEAKKYYRMAADQDYVNAQYNLGLLLEKEKNLAEAEKYYRLAADQGLDVAQCNLGYLLEKAGKLSEAEKYYRMAAENGLAIAQKNLRILLKKAGTPSRAEK